MGFGASLAFIAVGAVLAFAVKWDVPGIDLQMIGWILMLVGIAGMVLTSRYTRRPRVAEETVETIEPDTMYTVDPAAEPHTTHVRETETHSTVHPGERRVHVREETTPLPRDGV
ncbi:MULTISPECIES: DUF6458 family protein [Microbispora]|uniref:DUF6458 domain-containing protein n=3 Tax=Microbispora TaxID=2005 RepID=A0ABY3LMK7_9ACTN|nr:MULTISPECIES: DUF6458 family protein [Microbispora]GLW22505.1 hypothetical protein Mame01_25480 [Microbispora amethystogenes]MBO4270218.1 hypothetical protein [Microbispora triticiradicis]RGA04044.1 hypothetical protein DI270_015825 [Microbispora triticiradicis]TLP55254.1 hypothetical protein FED44_26425 [Microbispora fusca]TYB42664.1 hypothetical protein FXF59_34270 [Microbispora tritici]